MDEKQTLVIKKKKTANKLIKKDDTKASLWDFPADICNGKHLIFIYTNIIDYQ